jgi:hypothetical protein
MNERQVTLYETKKKTNQIIKIVERNKEKSDRILF